jgi:hypothetical protein
LKRDVAPDGRKQGLELAKNAIFECILGLICACKTVRFGLLSKTPTFVFNKLVASFVSNKQSFFRFSPAEDGPLTDRRGDAAHGTRAEAPPRPYNRSSGHFHGFWVPDSQQT